MPPLTTPHPSTKRQRVSLAETHSLALRARMSPPEVHGWKPLTVVGLRRIETTIRILRLGRIIPRMNVTQSLSNASVGCVRSVRAGNSSQTMPIERAVVTVIRLLPITIVTPVACIVPMLSVMRRLPEMMFLINERSRSCLQPISDSPILHLRRIGFLKSNSTVSLFRRTNRAFGIMVGYHANATSRSATPSK